MWNYSCRKHRGASGALSWAWDFREERVCSAEAVYTNDTEQNESCLMRAQGTGLLLPPTSMNILNQFQIPIWSF